MARRDSRRADRARFQAPQRAGSGLTSKLGNKLGKPQQARQHDKKSAAHNTHQFGATLTIIAPERCLMSHRVKNLLCFHRFTALQHVARYMLEMSQRPPSSASLVVDSDPPATATSFLTFWQFHAAPTSGATMQNTATNKTKRLRNATSAAAIAAALSAVAAPTAFAQAAAPTPEHTFATKLSLYSEYEYRGIAQTSEKPAGQLNFDYSHKSGFYAGAFLSNIKWIKDTKDVINAGLPRSTAAVPTSVSGSAGGVELDLFGGIKFEIIKDVTMDVGYLRYEYIGSDALVANVGRTSTAVLVNPNTDEVYVGLSSGAFSFKYSYSTGDTFGVANSKGSTFTEFNWSQEVMPKLTLNAQAARASFKNNSGLTYTVYKAGGTYDLGDGWNVGGYYKTTNAVEANYTYLGKDWSKGRLVAFVSKSF
jgi:uncharacterized protein (TIGR02001 family)